MQAIKVSLTNVETMLAGQIGVMRHTEALSRRSPNAFGLASDKDGWGLHVEGAAGEMAVAKALNVYWTATVNTYKEGGDIGRRIQVRTRSKHDYELIVRPSDRDDDVFVLVTGKSPTFHVHGWIYGHEAKKEAYLKDYGNRDPAYFVPHCALKALNEVDFNEFSGKRI